METPRSSLAGQMVLVTGAARRIGRSIARRLHDEGALVAIHYHTSEPDARSAAAECGGAPIFHADLMQVAQIERLFGEVGARWGRLDAVVNNAARFTRRDPLAITEADWDFIHGVNLKAVFFCSQQAARLMRAHGGGRIVNISSLGGIRPWEEHVHYCASKAGVIMLTRALAKALAPEIAVNSVAPGVIDFGDLTDRARAMVSDTPMARPGAAEEVADAVAYFLTAPKFITGQILAVDGGLSQR